MFILRIFCLYLVNKVSSVVKTWSLFKGQKYFNKRATFSCRFV